MEVLKSRSLHADMQADLSENKADIFGLRKELAEETAAKASVAVELMGWKDWWDRLSGRASDKDHTQTK